MSYWWCRLSRLVAGFEILHLNAVDADNQIIILVSEG